MFIKYFSQKLNIFDLFTKFKANTLLIFLQGKEEEKQKPEG